MELPTEVIDLEVCRKACSLRQKGIAWEDISKQLSLDPISARKAAKKWTKTCLKQHRCERCGCKLNSYNSTSLCSPCRPVVHPNNNVRGLPPELISTADREALEGLRQFLACEELQSESA